MKRLNCNWIEFTTIVVVLLSIFSTSYGFVEESSPKGSFPFLMPGVRPQKEDLYLCTPIKVDPTRNYYITAFEPNTTKNTAHHMIIYGCEEPGTGDPVWNCGEMSQNEASAKSVSPCRTGSQIVYAWAMDAPKLELPDGVGFQVGKDSPIKYLVLQVHYSNVDRFIDTKDKDNSGVEISYTTKKLHKLAGVILLGTSGVVPPMQIEHMETACDITEDKVIIPFAYRTHTHGLGKVVSGYRVRQNRFGNSDWVELGKRDPLTPQMFYPVHNTDPIRIGDTLAARCTMESDRATPTYVGATKKDEMCNFYLMYYVENTTPLETKYCFTNGPPKYYWHTGDIELNNIPDYEASYLPPNADNHKETHSHIH